jgi:hypothetical protein
MPTDNVPTAKNLIPGSATGPINSLPKDGVAHTVYDALGNSALAWWERGVIMKDRPGNFSFWKD